jgi:alcohol dehydrogenase, propanol-preferring
LAIQYAKALGARVCALDSGAKEQFCRELGADAFVNFAEFKEDEELNDAVRKVNVDGMKVVLVFSNGNRAYTQAMGFLGFRGTMVCLGVPEGEPVPIGGAKVLAMIDKELTIFGEFVHVLALCCGLLMRNFSSY